MTKKMRIIVKMTNVMRDKHIELHKNHSLDVCAYMESEHVMVFPNLNDINNLGQMMRVDLREKSDLVRRDLIYYLKSNKWPWSRGPAL